MKTKINRIIGKETTKEEIDHIEIAIRNDGKNVSDPAIGIGKNVHAHISVINGTKNAKNANQTCSEMVKLKSRKSQLTVSLKYSMLILGYLANAIKATVYMIIVSSVKFATLILNRPIDK